MHESYDFSKGKKSLHAKRLKKQVMVRKGFRKAPKTIDVSVGESVRIMRELQELSQNQLSELCGIPQSTISAIENDRVSLGVERASALARALRCHPAVLA
jgi:DNA-binding XRE family transcriptional regulator